MVDCEFLMPCGICKLKSSQLNGCVKCEITELYAQDLPKTAVKPNDFGTITCSGGEWLANSISQDKENI